MYFVFIVRLPPAIDSLDSLRDAPPSLRILPARSYGRIAAFWLLMSRAERFNQATHFRYFSSCVGPLLKFCTIFDEWQLASPVSYASTSSVGFEAGKILKRGGFLTAPS